jgi:hypothetical protein
MEAIALGRSLESRVSKHTSPFINEMLMTQIKKTLLFYEEYPDRIDNRIHRLKTEWDIERALETNASILGLFGMFMALILRRTWFILLPVAILGFLLQHAIQGWCPPVSVFRRFGVRTKEEIQLELYGLRMLRGDFNDVPELTSLPLKDRIERVMEKLSR